MEAGSERMAGSQNDNASERRPLPSGLVTFLLTDIEGSTRLFRELGDGYVALLKSHHEILRSAIERGGGSELNTEGDSFLVAFPDARDALLAAVEAQLELGRATWPGRVDLRVRMGLHTGEANPVGGDYVSLAIHQVARISGGAHGGQILISESTAEMLHGQLPADMGLEDLGSFHLRGFSAPERLFQVVHPELRHRFPPIRAIGVLAHNLPHFRSSFVGRGVEREGLARALRTTGLVTLVGTGGVGKTRLAVQVAFDLLAEFADGAWFVDLSPLIDPATVPGALAGALGIGDVASRSILDVVVDALRPKSSLLILDNCEHLLEAVADVVETLTTRCPDLVILATSREPLGTEGEIVWRIGSLTTSQAAGAPDGQGPPDAVQLFFDRARQADPTFEPDGEGMVLVAEVVEQLNGIPLAIELGAAALAERSLAGVHAGLADRFSMLTRGRRTAPDRHQTLRDAIEWSLDLLPSPERALFRRLSVFAGGGSVTAAASICNGDGVEEQEVGRMLRHLARASLITSIDERWSVLESLRQLGHLELSEAGEASSFEERHRLWFCEWVESVEPLLGRRGQAVAAKDLARDRLNVRRAIQSAARSGDATTALRLSTAMAPFWISHGDWTEGAQRLESALAVDGGSSSRRRRAEVALGNLQVLRGEIADAERLLSLSVDNGIEDDATLASALAGIGYVAFRRSDLELANQSWERALAHARSAGDDRLAANVLRSLAIASASRGDQDTARLLLEEGIETAERAEDDQILRLLLGSLAEMSLWLGRYQDAKDQYGQALDVADEIGDVSARPLLLAELGWIALLEGSPRLAADLATQAVELAEDLGAPRVLAHATRLLGESAIDLGDIEAADQQLRSALEITNDLSSPPEVSGVETSRAYLALTQRQFDEAGRLAEEARTISSLRHPMRRVSATWISAVVELERGDVPLAEALFEEGSELARQIDAPRPEADSLWGLGRSAHRRGDDSGAARYLDESLSTRERIGDRLGMARCLLSLAAVGAKRHPSISRDVLVGGLGIFVTSEATLSPFDGIDRGEAEGHFGEVPAGLPGLDEATALVAARELIDRLTEGHGESRRKGSR